MTAHLEGDHGQETGPTDDREVGAADTGTSGGGSRAGDWSDRRPGNCGLGACNSGP